MKFTSENWLKDTGVDEPHYYQEEGGGEGEGVKTAEEGAEENEEKDDEDSNKQSTFEVNQFYICTCTCTCNTIVLIVHVQCMCQKQWKQLLLHAHVLYAHFTNQNCITVTVHETCI